MTGIARIGDVFEGKCKNHGDTTGTVITGSSTVMINGLNVATISSMGQLDCNDAHQATVITGASTVFVEGLALHRIGDVLAGDPNDTDLFTCITGSTDVIADDQYADVEPEEDIDMSNYSSASTAKVRSEAGRYAVFDEIESISETPSDYGPDSGAPPVVAPTTAPVQNQATTTTPSQGACIMSNTINYDLKLSPNFTLGNFTTNALFSHKLQAQAGFSVSELICNLQSLSNEVVEKINAQFPGLRINSGFRTVTTGKSQHEKGMACDIQWPTKSPKDYLPIAKWIADNLVFDQLIFEHGNSIWIHVSFNRTAAVQRKQVLTMFNKVYTPGLTLHY